MPGRIAECRCVSTIHAAYSKRSSAISARSSVASGPISSYDAGRATPPESGAYLNFGLVMQRTGQLWMYDVRLEVVSDDVPVTDFLAMLPLHPTNMDFEDGTN
jgi:hypothetical protein